MEEENARYLKPQSALNRLLGLSLEEALNEFLNHLVHLPWLGLNPTGAVFLFDHDREVAEALWPY